MKRTLVGLAMAIMVVGLAGSANAVPVEFDIDGPGSFVSVSSTPYLGNASLTGALVSGLGVNNFTLDDNESMEIDFFTLTSSGFGYGSYSVEAILAFTLPTIGPAEGEGGGFFGSAWICQAIISGGFLTWGDTTPDTFSILGGPTIKVEFEQGVAVVVGRTVTIHASITNMGGGTTPVPEPGTLALLGSGLVGLALIRRKKAKKF